MTVPQQGNGRLPVGARRVAIVSAAAELFAARGYHATGIDDIGDAVDVTGPAIYRHFEGKIDILIEVIEGWMRLVMDGVDRITSTSPPPAEALDQLIDNFVTCTVEAPAAFAVMARERHHLPKEERRVIERAHRRHVDAWVRNVREVHPGMSDGEARTLVHGVFGLAAPATTRQPKMAGEELGALLRSMATEVIRRGGGRRRVAAP